MQSQKGDLKITGSKCFFFLKQFPFVREGWFSTILERS